MPLSFPDVPRSYDYANALDNIVPQVAPTVKAKGGFLVLRPDSGDPVETVLMGLRAADKTFGSDMNGKGYKTPRGCSVLQGDGIDLEASAPLASPISHARISHFTDLSLQAPRLDREADAPAPSAQPASASVRAV